MIHLVVALPAEARALIRHFRLRDKCSATAFPVYRNERMALIVSGPGKVSAAAATASLQATSDAVRHAAWLNIGIAGHATQTIGTGLGVYRITDRSTKQNWYPPQVLGFPAPAENLVTVDQPGEAYLDNTLQDMEASGFYPIACRYVTGELVQCFKVVSDNREQTAAGINAQLCEQLIAAQLGTIEALAGEMQELVHEYATWHAPHPELEQITGQWHFTVSQRHQLAELLRRWKTLLPQQPPRLDGFEQQTRAVEILRHLEHYLDHYAGRRA